MFFMTGLVLLDNAIAIYLHCVCMYTVYVDIFVENLISQFLRVHAPKQN